MPITLTGGQVHDLRVRLGISQAELARALGYTRQAICKWERRADRSIPRTQYERVVALLLQRQQRTAALLAPLPTPTPSVARNG